MLRDQHVLINLPNQMAPVVECLSIQELICQHHETCRAVERLTEQLKKAQRVILQQNEKLEELGYPFLFS